MDIENFSSRLAGKYRESIFKFEGFIKSPNRLQNASLVIGAVLVGLVAVGYAKVFHLVENAFLSIATQYQYASFILGPIFFFLAWFIVFKFAREASGSGIPQVIAASEMGFEGEQRKQINSLLSIRTAAVKILSSLLCLAGGGAIGREGPTLQISACIFHFFGRRLKNINPRVHLQTFIIAGASAGLASAFNTPLGGIVYAIEEFGSHHFQKLKTALLAAVIISGLIAQWILGSYLFLGFPKIAPAGIESVPSSLLVGAIAGISGALFSSILLFLGRKKEKLKSGKALAVFAMTCGLVMGLLILLSKYASGAGTEIISGFLFEGLPPDPLIILIRVSGTIISYLSGAAGGIFSPSLTIGAAVGAEVSSLINSSNANLMILMGMIGFLTGVTKTPFTSFILVMEMSDRHSAILPMMIAAGTAHFFSNLITKKSFYEEVKEKYMVQV